MPYKENNYENAIIEEFQNSLGYSYIYGPEIDRDYREVLLLDELRISLEDINSSISDVGIDEAILKLRDIDNGSMIQKNKLFMEYLQDGIPISYFSNGEDIDEIVYLVDYKNIDNNRFIIANQWTIEGKSIKRPDIILFLNGIPIVVFELKSPSREETDASEAYNQLRNYMQEIPLLFTYNGFLVMSDLAISKAGTITADEDRFMEWKTVDGNYEDTQFAKYDTLIKGIFDKERLLDILKNFICFSEDKKILAAYHQYFAVRKANISTRKAVHTDGKAGVFWHTQGSGKSLSMVFYAHLLEKSLDSPTIVVITDRNDLDDQLFSQFAKCSKFLRQEPIQAKDRKHLVELLKNRQENGIFFTTMQKFEEGDGFLSDRKNIIVMADEAHRSQYGLNPIVNETTGVVTIGNARVIRDALPNATFIGFTGTPISSKDKSTVEVFGNYIDVYDMTQSVEDGATRPIYYESRVIKLYLDDKVLKDIDHTYDMLVEETEEYTINRSKRDLSHLDSILGADSTIESLVKDIIKHYEENRQDLLTGKAMIVAYSRQIAMKIYNKILEIRPEWKDKIGVVMTSSNKDPEKWHDIIGNKKHKKDMAKKFKDDEDPFKIAIVVDMWLTGFDVPSLATMYVYKPMEGHNLMQAIARVNRVYKDKEGGLIVDYVGIAKYLKQAMRDYTKRDKDNYGNMDISETAYKKFKEKLEVCQSLLYGFNYSKFMKSTATDGDRAKLITGGVNFLVDRLRTDDKDNFIKEAMVLKQSTQLCCSLLLKEERIEAAYFEAVRTILTRITPPNKPLSIKEVNKRINELLKNAIKSKGVINLFSDKQEEVSIFDSKFLKGLSKMKEKNLALELLKKLIDEQVKIFKRTNLVQSEKFSEMMSKTMKAYLNGQLTNEQVIQELINMANDIAKYTSEGNSLGLTSEELAFYDAITKPENIKDFYKNDELIAITHELTDQLRKSRTIDWQKKETARAKMRVMVKKLLRKYKYPPEGMEDAIQTVIKQCEMWADN
ncbi:MAG: type I restriction endonuclease subunit R [Lachnospiraceae bacterium]|jgi:type I restriction enzyme R subunit|nr:type I restriction endonuclease subunit R [Lachnospiraceae bacterium]